MTIYYRPRFIRAFRRLDPQIQKVVKKDIVRFQRDRSHPALRAHALHGKLKGFWSFSAAGRYRILFQFLDNKKTEAVFLDVGDHAIYR